MAKRCLNCGAESVTKDHVISRFVLRTTLSREEYEEFNRLTGKRLNKQPLCPKCNSDKGYDVIDYRGSETAEQLRDILRELFDVDIEIEVPDE